MAESMQVTVCYAAPEREFLRPVQVAPGATIAQAIEQSGVLAEFPDINLATHPVGVYAKKKPLDTELRERDRVEIYRPLVADPKDSRRRRAAKKQASS
jgi:putative ubiquitin-RnfH superfamily antitoxin RatB of RatAB toxin-antitoxin module